MCFEFADLSQPSTSKDKSVDPGPSTSEVAPRTSVFVSDDDDDVDFNDDEFVLPDDVSDVDPEILCTLPPSVQYDILLKLRDRQFGENRETFSTLSGTSQNVEQ